MPSVDQRPVLVVGGSGFVGRHLVEALQREGRTVRVFDRRPLNDLAVDQIIGDLRDPLAVQRACHGVQTVFQTASLVDWRPGNDALLHAVNVQGQRNVITACQAQGQINLVYTSSIDVVFDGQPISDGDESLPYPRRHLDAYAHTKMLAERETLAAHGQNGLRTCALRLAGVYGPRDPYRLPEIVQLARRNQFWRLGDGRARFNHVYVENTAHAHLCAETALNQGRAGGQSYFIADQPASNFFAFVASFATDLGLPAPPRSIPFAVAYALAAALEGGAWLSRGRLGNPAFTRYVVASTCRDFCFRSERAARELGYVPPVSAQVARERTLAWLRQQSYG
ncbi:MAG: NAD-dependent epimerase/dehydratase family protein [Oscillochloridaceae bacterium umkhey_bin13]